MTTAAELFQALYQIDGTGADLSGARVHHGGADDLCRACGAEAVTIGSDIYFRTGAFAPCTPSGLWLLAHEAAHVVQQRRGPVSGQPPGAGPRMTPAAAAEEAEANAAADAVLAGRPFGFAPRPAPGVSRTGQPVIQRYMAWEHLVLGSTDAAAAGGQAVQPTDPDGLRHLQAQCALLQELAERPGDVDDERLRDRYPGLETLRLPASGVVVTLGELNILPDYFSNPADIGSAPAAFMLPLIQSVRAQNVVALQRAMGHAYRRPRFAGAMRYSRRPTMSELYEGLALHSAGKRCGFGESELYGSVIARNAAHFAPFSWYRWQAFHLMARDMIGRSAAMPSDQRDELRAKARLYAGYADHFLQDSFAAGHLPNKTLIMQWYAEWLASTRLPAPGRHLLATMTYAEQPLLHGPGHYQPTPGEAGARLLPGGEAAWTTVTDPQTAAEAATLDERIAASGITGASASDRRAAYSRYLSFLGSSVVQNAAGAVHKYFNDRSLVVASQADGPRYRIWGDRTMFTPDPDGQAGAVRAAAAAATSRRAIAQLLARGGTDITSREIFEAFPSRVEVNGALLTLPQWHQDHLREQCFQEIFRLPSTQVPRLLLTVSFRRLGVPSPDCRTPQGSSSTGSPTATRPGSTVEP